MAPKGDLRSYLPSSQQAKRGGGLLTAGALALAGAALIVNRRATTSQTGSVSASARASRPPRRPASTPAASSASIGQGSPARRPGLLTGSDCAATGLRSQDDAARPEGQQLPGAGERLKCREYIRDAVEQTSWRVSVGSSSQTLCSPIHGLSRCLPARKALAPTCPRGADAETQPVTRPCLLLNGEHGKTGRGLAQRAVSPAARPLPYLVCAGS